MISAEWKQSAFASPRVSQAQRALVERVLASETFAQSKRLSSLLAYLCDMTFAGRADELSEQHIGEAVFARSPDYDTMADGIVRTQASRLRTRLDLYFSREGATEPVRITIPRGVYAPVFEPHPESSSAVSSQLSVEPGAPVPSVSAPLDLSAQPSIQAESAVRAPAKSRFHPLRSLALAWSVAGCAVLAVLAMLFVAPWMRAIHSHPSPPSPPAHSIWSELFVPGQTTLLVPGDSSLVIYQGIKGRNLTLDEYISGAYRDFHPIGTGSDEVSAINLASRRYTSLVDLKVAAALGRIARGREATLEVRYPRELRADDLKQGNLILVGDSEADPWITLFERGMNFTFHNDRKDHILSVLNRAPRGNEPKQWDSTPLRVEPQQRVYAVVAWLPNLSGNGHVLLVEGTTVAGTECAWDFVNDDTRLEPFLRSIRRPNGVLPPFELLLDASNIAGNASQSNILAYRTH